MAEVSSLQERRLQDQKTKQQTNELRESSNDFEKKQKVQIRKYEDIIQKTKSDYELEITKVKTEYDKKKMDLLRRQNEIMKMEQLKLDEAKVRATLWNEIYYDKFDTWDYQWDYCRFFNEGVGINPKYNLISNLGFGDHATHTKDCLNPMSNLPRKSLEFPLKHPEHIRVDEEYDETYLQKYIYRPSWKIPLSVLKKKIFRTLRLSF
ncbi:MAG: hypothetical protein HQK51_19090 [Oligoflexia bacterium]|nr:hypothetical protein [Oligoflexia bacterium]